MTTRPRLEICTITGADDSTSFKQLNELRKEFPFLEVGVLVGSTDRQGTPRYPSIEVFESNEIFKYNGGLSLHLCGSKVAEFLVSPRKDVLPRVGPILFNRLQLNFPNSNRPIVEILRASENMQQVGTELILPLKKGDFSIVSTDLRKTCHFLVDDSGGRGTKITSYPVLQGAYVGYAGGLGPDNIADTILELSNNPPGGYWIDMETNVRSVIDGKDVLDLDKVHFVLETIQNMKKEGLA